MAMIHCKNNGPDLWGWGAEKETGAALIQERARVGYHIKPETKNGLLVIARPPPIGGLAAFATVCQGGDRGSGE